MHNFYTDVILKDHRFETTDIVSDIMLLEPVTRTLVQKIIADAAAEGVHLMVFETYRSQQRQQLLFNEKKTELRQVGVHHYGLACDIVYVLNGHPSWQGDFSRLGRYAHKNGLIWGGDWGNPAIHHTFVDADHVQRVTIARQEALFAGTWYPDQQYIPYTDH